MGPPLNFAAMERQSAEESLLALQNVCVPEVRRRGVASLQGVTIRIPQKDRFRGAAKKAQGEGCPKCNDSCDQRLVRQEESFCPHSAVCCSVNRGSRAQPLLLPWSGARRHRWSQSARPATCSSQSEHPMPPLPESWRCRRSWAMGVDGRLRAGARVEPGVCMRSWAYTVPRPTCSVLKWLRASRKNQGRR